MAVDIKQAHRRIFEEAYGKGKLEVFDELCDRSYRSHDPFTGDASLEQTKESCRMYRAAFPDMQPTTVGSFLDGDTVVTQWRMVGTHQGALMNIAPSGARCTVEGITIGKFRGGLSTLGAAELGRRLRELDWVLDERTAGQVHAQARHYLRGPLTAVR